MSSIKEQMIKIITEQPDDSSFKEILQELNFSAMVNKGLKDSLKQNVTPTQQLKEEIQTW
jgi:arsenate reductase-like glutaredoxin family protein